jgi:CRP-like cAMP-binding protein
VTEFLAQLAASDRDALTALGHRRSLPKGAYLIAEGARSGPVFAVLSGHVKVFSVTDGGAEVVLAVRGPGALLGELAAVDDEPRAASVTALEPVEVLAIPVETFRAYLTGHPDVTLLLMRTITSRLRDADRKRVEFGSHDAVGRVARRLVELAERFGEPDGSGIRITVPFTQDELAGWVGASREAVVKALRILRGRGHVTTQRRTVVICDLEALRRRAGPL